MALSNRAAFVFADLSLARRLERAEGHGCVDFVAARAKQAPDSGACWTEVAGTYAAYDGVASPITQTFGLGVVQPPTAADFDHLEAFYHQFAAPVFHEVSPLADPATFALLNARNYRPFEFSSVMFRGTEAPTSHGDAVVTVRIVDAHDFALWAETSTRGWSEHAEFAALIQDLALVSVARAGAVSFLAEIGGRPVATGGLFLSDGVALLAGASTVPDARNQGAQAALLSSRLRYAHEHGCDVAMMCALPGSASQRNAERQGFRIAYTRTKWHLVAMPSS